MSPRMTAEQWTRVDQVRELVKQEGDARCEAAFDDLVAEVVMFRHALERLRQSTPQLANGTCWYCAGPFNIASKAFEHVDDCAIEEADDALRHRAASLTSASEEAPRGGDSARTGEA